MHCRKLWYVFNLHPAENFFLDLIKSLACLQTFNRAEEKFGLEEEHLCMAFKVLHLCLRHS